MMMGSINFFMVWGICLFDNNLGVGRFSCGARILWFFRAESLCGNLRAGIRPLIRSGCHCWLIRAEICLQIRSDCCCQAIRAEKYLKTRAESLCGNFWAGIRPLFRSEFHCWSIRAEICLQIRSDCCRQAIRAEKYLKTRAESIAHEKMSRNTPQNRDKCTRAQRIPNKNLYNSAIITTFARSKFFWDYTYCLTH